VAGRKLEVSLFKLHMKANKGGDLKKRIKGCNSPTWGKSKVSEAQVHLRLTPLPLQHDKVLRSDITAGPNENKP
jgi:hypothetical protein